MTLSPPIQVVVFDIDDTLFSNVATSAADSTPSAVGAKSGSGDRTSRHWPKRRSTKALAATSSTASCTMAIAGRRGSPPPMGRCLPPSRSRHRIAFGRETLLGRSARPRGRGSCLRWPLGKSASQGPAAQTRSLDRLGPHRADRQSGSELRKTLSDGVSEHPGVVSVRRGKLPSIWPTIPPRIFNRRGNSVGEPSASAGPAASTPTCLARFRWTMSWRIWRPCRGCWDTLDLAPPGLLQPRRSAASLLGPMHVANRKFGNSVKNRKV